MSFFWPRNTNRVLTAPLPVFSILGNSSLGPTRTQLEIRKDREISTRVCLNLDKEPVQKSPDLSSFKVGLRLGPG